MKQFIVSMILVVVYLAVCSCHRPTPRWQTKIRKFVCEEIASIKEENEKITSALEREISAFEREISALEKEIDDLRLQQSLSETKTTVLEEEVNELKILEEEVNELKIQSVKAGYKSAFAIYGKEPIGTGINEILRVHPDGVTTNEGGHYNNATGVYTAPYPGLYAFVLSIYKDPLEDDGVQCWIYRNDNGQPLAHANAIHKSGFRGASGATLVQLDEGETVFVQCGNVENLDSWTSYMGFLLKAY